MATVSFEAPTATHTLNQKTLIGLWKYVTSAFFFFFFFPPPAPCPLPTRVRSDDRNRNATILQVKTEPESENRALSRLWKGSETRWMSSAGYMFLTQLVKLCFAVLSSSLTPSFHLTPSWMSGKSNEPNQLWLRPQCNHSHYPLAEKLTHVSMSH